MEGQKKRRKKGKDPPQGKINRAVNRSYADKTNKMKTSLSKGVSPPLERTQSTSQKSTSPLHIHQEITLK